MKIKILIIITILLALLVGGYFMKNFMPGLFGNEKKLSISITSNKNTYKVGDKIFFEVKLKNVGESSFYIFPHNDNKNTNDWIQVLDKKGQKLPDFTSATIDPRVFAKEKDFIFLKPGQEEYIQKSFDIIIKNELDEGLLFSSGYFSIYLGEPRSFKIRSKYKNKIKTYLDEKNEKKNIFAWTGELFSEEINIKIEDQDNNIKQDKTKINLEKAIEIGEKELERIGYDYVPEHMRVLADDKNTEWEEFVKIDPLILQNERIKKMNLKRKNYWALYYAPKKLSLGGDAWVFVDRDNGEILGNILGK
ncbi:MAG: hypothetical protein Q7T79_00560 [bacterium]|nr:hypothetical protein [bacterium]